MSSKISTGQWQKVQGSGSKKTVKLTKGAKKELEKKLPKIEDLPPLDILPTSFESLIPKEKSITASIHAVGNSVAKPSQKKKPQKQKSVAAKYKYTKFSEAIQKVSFDDVIKSATQAKEKLTNADQLIYLKEIATRYNVALSCPDESPSTTMPVDYPWTQVPKKAQGKLTELMVSSSNETERKAMFKFCLENMLKCIEKDQCSWGFRISLQVLAMNCSSQLCTGLSKHLEDILRRENVPKRCLAYMWALGSLGVNSPKHGMEVWLRLMMNLLHLKSLAQYSVFYIEQLLERCGTAEKQLSGSVSAQDFVTFLSLSFDANSSLNKNLQMKLQKIYPQMKVLALPGNCRQIFEIFLKSEISEISSYKETFVEVAIECLQKDIKCFSVWRQFYTETFPMTRELLLYVDLKGNAALKLNASELRKTMQAFHNTNCDAAQSSQVLTSKKEFKDIFNICKEYQDSLKHPESSVGSSVLVTSLAVIVIAILATFLYDFYLHNFVVEKTMTYDKLRAIGAIKYLALVWKNVRLGGNKLFVWSRTNIFPTLSKLSKFFFPYILSFGEMIYSAIQWILFHTEGIRSILAIYAKVALEWMDDVANFLWPYFAAAAEKVMSFVSQLISGEISWCCVKAFIYNCYVALVNYAATLWTSAMDFVSGTELESG